MHCWYNYKTSRLGFNNANKLSIDSSIISKSALLVQRTLQWQRCQIFPLWNLFRKNIVFSYPKQRCRVAARPKRYKTVWDSLENCHVGGA